MWRYMPVDCSTIPTRSRSARGRCAGSSPSTRHVAAAARPVALEDLHRGRLARRRWARAARRPRRRATSKSMPRTASMLAVALAQARDLDGRVREMRHLVEMMATRWSAPASTSARTPRACSSPSPRRRPAARGLPAARASRASARAARRRAHRARRSTRSRRGGDRGRARASGPRAGVRAGAVVATAAIRDAEQPRRAVRAVRSRSGVDVEVLTGERGGAARVRRRHRHAGRARRRHRRRVVDVGGGSSEIASARSPAASTWSASRAGRLGRPGRTPTCAPTRRRAHELAAVRPSTSAARFEGLDPPARARPSPSAAAPPRCAAWSARVLEPTRPSSAACACSRRRRRPRSAAALRARRRSACACCRRASSLLEAARRRIGQAAADRPRRACARASSWSIRRRSRAAHDARWPRPATSPTSPPTESYARGRRAGRSPCARGSSSTTPRTCSTPATSSASTTCASPRGGCARCWRSSRPASRARPSTATCSRRQGARRRARRAPRPRRAHRRSRTLRRRRQGRRPAGRRGLLAERLRSEQAAGNEELAAALAAIEQTDLRGRLAALSAAASPRRPARSFGLQRPTGGRVKARRVKGLDPDEPLADNAERIVRVRLDELYSFIPRALDPARGQGAARHAHRGQAPALHPRGRAAPCFGAYATTRDASAPRTSRTCSARSTTATCCSRACARCSSELRAADALEARALAGDAADLDPTPGPGHAARGAPRRGLETLRHLPRGAPRAAVRALPGALARPRAQGLPRAPARTRSASGPSRQRRFHRLTTATNRRPP